MDEHTPMYSDISNWVDFIKHIRDISLDVITPEQYQFMANNEIKRMFDEETNEYMLTFPHPERKGQICSLRIMWETF